MREEWGIKEGMGIMMVDVMRPANSLPLLLHLFTPFIRVRERRVIDWNMVKMMGTNRSLPQYATFAPSHSYRWLAEEGRDR